MKGIDTIRNLIKALPQHSLMTIYKSFVRPHFDYGDIIYDQLNKESLNRKTERIQYNAVLAITGAIKGTYQSRFYNELGLEYLKFRRFLGNCVPFIKLKQQLYHNTIIILFHKPIIYIILVQQRM